MTMKRLFTIVAIVLCAIFGTQVYAQNIITAHFAFEEPVVGAKPSTSVKVLDNDSLVVSEVKWRGSFDSKGCFMAKEKYNLSLVVTPRRGVDMVFPSRYKYVKFYLNDHYLSAGLILEDGKKISTGWSFTIELPKHVVDVTKVYTQQQADELWPVLYAEKHGGDLIVNEALIQELGLQKSRQRPIDQILGREEMKYSAATRVLIDYPADKDCVAPSGASMFYHPNAKEFWLSPEMDLNVFLQSFFGARGNKEPLYAYNSNGGTTWDFTLYVSDKVLPEGLLSLRSPSGASPSIRLRKFRTLLYSGDVYEAFERAGRGEKVGREWCPGHVYTDKIMTADRTVSNRSCLKTEWYYYSCRHCGKCEYNDRHIFATDVYGKTRDDLSGAMDHVWGRIIDPSHYVGVNVEGDPVYVNTCLICGNDYRQVERCDAYVTPQRFKYLTAAAMEISYEQYAEQCRKSWDSHVVKHMLKATVEHPHPCSFAVEAEKVVSAKVDPWAMNDVQYASQNDLVDLSLMGDDYTRPISRLQFCSVAVRFVEKLLERKLTADPAGIFGDILGATSDSGQDAALTREQMAACMYRCLMYVREHSNMRFTPYESRLDTYEDANKLSSWAVEPMAFMNALGLVPAKTATTLDPGGICTVQEVLQVAFRSLSADDIGWYQCYKVPSMYPFYRNHGPITQTSYDLGDRVWVSAKDAEGWLSVIDPCNGLDRQVPVGDFRPIRVLKDTDDDLYYEYVPKDRHR